MLKPIEIFITNIAIDLSRSTTLSVTEAIAVVECLYAQGYEISKNTEEKK